ncbi:hypothetical protein LCGC14_1617300 [marine sediment metagenome]|uniref:Uncharacterized protein n=1 Tax=marine sediment metagenome TaxID=412755 RepID=A0A0F9ITD1_9ZZZZ
MTDKRKIKHAIEVLKEIENRFIAVRLADMNVTSDISGPVEKNILDLRKLLENPHVVPKKKIGRADPIWNTAVMLAKRLEAHIRSRKPNLRPIQSDTWATDIDLILRIDKRTSEKLQEVIDWCQQDNFWQNNILSPAKLRKQLDRLELQMAKDWQYQKRKLHQQTPRVGKSAKDKYLESLGKTNGNT